MHSLAPVINVDVSELPLLVSFPRSGSHWLLCALEIYLKRPRALYTTQGAFRCQITLLDERRSGLAPAFLHTHDVDLRIGYDPRKVVYLYRDPSSLLFSLIKLVKARSTGPLTELSVRRCLHFHAVQYRRHLEKYLLSARKAATLLRYEALQRDMQAGFRKICAHFGVAFDSARAAESWRYVTKRRLAERAAAALPAFFNHEMDSAEYSAERSAFIEQHRTFIESLVLTRELAPFFEPVE